MLVNTINPLAKSDPDVFNATIPAVSIRNAKVINKLPSPRLIMTHSCWRPEFKNAIYVVRDGRDAFISSYHYHITRNKLSLSIEKYYELYSAGTYGITWEENVASWLREGRARMGDHLMIVRFEEMIKNPVNVVGDICSFIGVGNKGKAIHTAIEQATLEQAQKIENQREGVIADSNAAFYRKGSTEQWKQSEYANVIALFQKRAADSLQLAGYTTTK